LTETLIDLVIDTVARHYGVDPLAITGRSRLNSASVARGTAMYVARLAGDFSYTEIGNAFHRDHTTVMAACKSITRRMTQKAMFQKEVEGLVAECLGLGRMGVPVNIRKELMALLQEKVKQGIYGRSVEDIVDRILCSHFQSEISASGAKR
jgi:hypothetical protein